jgi:Lsr2
MSREVITIMRDDIDGSEDDVQLVEFTWKGKPREIDLGPKQRAMLEEIMADYVNHSRPASRPASGAVPARKPRGQGNNEVAEQRARSERIRGWAQENGLKIADRGRIPAKIVAAYEAGNPGLAAS